MKKTIKGLLSLCLSLLMVLSSVPLTTLALDETLEVSAQNDVGLVNGLFNNAPEYSSQGCIETFNASDFKRVHFITNEDGVDKTVYVAAYKGDFDTIFHYDSQRVLPSNELSKSVNILFPEEGSGLFNSYHYGARDIKPIIEQDTEYIPDIYVGSEGEERPYMLFMVEGDEAPTGQLKIYHHSKSTDTAFNESEGKISVETRCSVCGQLTDNDLNFVVHDVTGKSKYTVKESDIVVLNEPISHPGFYAYFSCNDEKTLNIKLPAEAEEILGENDVLFQMVKISNELLSLSNGFYKASAEGEMVDVQVARGSRASFNCDKGSYIVIVGSKDTGTSLEFGEVEKDDNWVISNSLISDNGTLVLDKRLTDYLHTTLGDDETVEYTFAHKYIGSSNIATVPAYICGKKVVGVSPNAFQTSESADTVALSKEFTDVLNALYKDYRDNDSRMYIFPFKGDDGLWGNSFVRDGIKTLKTHFCYFLGNNNEEVRDTFGITDDFAFLDIKYNYDYTHSLSVESLCDFSTDDCTAQPLSLTCAECGSEITAESGELIYSKYHHNRHSFAEDEEYTPPTCQKEGEYSKRCEYCNQRKVTQKVNKIPHNLVFDENQEGYYKCKTGMYAYTCTMCGETFYEVVQATEKHTPDREFPSCVSNIEYTCTVCGETVKETVSNPSEHTFDDGIYYIVNDDFEGVVDFNSKKVTVHEKGMDESQTVPFCFLTKEQWDSVLKGATYQKCMACGEMVLANNVEINSQHEYVKTVDIKPTCTDKGYVEYECTICGNKLSEYLDSLGNEEHADTVTVKTEYGYDIVCSVCKRVLSRVYEVNPDEETTIPAVTKHSYNDASGKMITISNCELYGNVPSVYVIFPRQEKRDVFNNGSKLSVNFPVGDNPNFKLDEYGYIVSGGKGYGYTGDEEYNYSIAKITNWYEISPNVISFECHHEYYVIEELSPTCVTEGYKIYKCDNCGDEYTEVIKKLAHEYSYAEYVEPTCTETGYRVMRCGMCGDEYNVYDTPNNALGHNYEPVYILSTCTQEGTLTRKVCTRCGDVDSPTETLSKAKHSYRIKRTAATCTEEGSVKAECVNCGDMYIISSIPKTNHTYILSKEIKPSCMSSGEYTYTCKLCGETYKDIVPPLSHNFVITKSVKANYESDGYTESTCTLCSEKHTETTQKRLTAPTVSTPNLNCQLSDNGISLNWNSCNNAMGYIVMVSVDGAEYKKISNTQATKYSLNKPKAYTNYAFYVVAYTKENGKLFYSAASNTVKIKTKLSVPEVTKFKKSGKKLKVVHKKSKNSDGYELQFSQSKDFKNAKTVKSVKKSKKYSVYKLKKNKTYYVRIRAYAKSGNSTDYSGWSGIKSITV